MLALQFSWIRHDWYSTVDSCLKRSISLTVLQLEINSWHSDTHLCLQHLYTNIIYWCIVLWNTKYITNFTFFATFIRILIFWQYLARPSASTTENHLQNYKTFTLNPSLNRYLKKFCKANFNCFVVFRILGWSSWNISCLALDILKTNFWTDSMFRKAPRHTRVV